VFQRFTERARQVVVLAQDEARTLKHNYIGTEHILLGLLREEEGLAARVLESLDIAVEEVRAQVARIVGQGDEVTSGQIPFTPRAKRVLELALREAHELGHNYIGTEHILLGLVRENEAVAAKILLDLNADAEKIRNEIIRMLPSFEGKPTDSAGATTSRTEQPKPTPEGDDGIADSMRAPTIGELIDAAKQPEARADLDRTIVAATRALTVNELIDSVRTAKETAIKSKEFPRAAGLRDIERKLVKLFKSH
jgi:ATP-dependent Clp protease ATP-binding subunit ClpA